MAENLISGFLSPSALVIKDAEDGTIQAKNLKISRVHIKLSSNAMKHMLEDGSTVVDSRIIMPSTITIDAFCPDAETVKQLNNLLMDRINFYTVSSKGITLENMMMEADQATQSADIMSAVPVRISMRQVISSNIEAVVVAQPSDSTLVDRGRALLSTATKSVTDVYNKIAGIF